MKSLKDMMKQSSRARSFDKWYHRLFSIGECRYMSSSSWCSFQHTHCSSTTMPSRLLIALYLWSQIHIGFCFSTSLVLLQCVSFCSCMHTSPSSFCDSWLVFLTNTYRYFPFLPTFQMFSRLGLCSCGGNEQLHALSGSLILYLWCHMPVVFTSFGDEPPQMHPVCSSRIRLRILFQNVYYIDWYHLIRVSLVFRSS